MFHEQKKKAFLVPYSMKIKLEVHSVFILALLRCTTTNGVCTHFTPHAQLRMVMLPLPLSSSSYLLLSLFNCIFQSHFVFNVNYSSVTLALLVSTNSSNSAICETCDLTHSLSHSLSLLAPLSPLKHAQALLFVSL